MNNICFTLDNKEEITSFFEKNGYVVIRVLTEDECKDTLDDINRLMKEKESRFDIFDVQTYDLAPIKSGFPILGSKPLFSYQLLKNRCHHNISKAFELLYGRSDLIVHHDRVGFYRPTKNVLIGDTRLDKPEWKSRYVYPEVHLDFNPNVYDTDLVRIARNNITYKEYDEFIVENQLYAKDMGAGEYHLQLQGVLNLMDNRIEDGGFQCIPGFHKRFNEWRRNINTEYISTSPSDRYVFSSENMNDMNYVSDPQRIPSPAGCITIWDMELAHGTLPNNSDRPRVTQYIRLSPSCYLSDTTRSNRRLSLCCKINKDELDFDIKVLDL